MRHKLFTLFLALIASTGLLFAESGTCGDNLTWDLTDSVLTVSGTGAMTDWSSTSKIPWYSKRSAIKTVVIEDGATSIGTNAFSPCKNLTSVTISNSVTIIGAKAFYQCTGLTSIALGNSVESIDLGAFYGCTALKSIEIPGSVTSIGSTAFSGCKGFTSFTIPNSVTSIGESAFSGCSNLTSITIGNSVTSIGGSAFYNCSALTSVEIPNSVTSIGGSAFYNCSALTSVEIPNSVTSMGEKVFYQCKALTSATIGNNVTSIGESAFSGCSNLASVTIGNSVTSIGASAFYYCSKLTSVEIPNSVTTIGGSAFYTCSGLTSVTIGDNVTSIGNKAFNYCSKLTSVTIPDGVTSIGDYAFGTCTGLTSVTIGNGVTSIGTYAFGGCTKLASVTLGNSVTSIGESAFSGCKALTSLTLPNSLTSIGTEAFYNSALTAIEIPNSVTSMGEEAFYFCSRLTSVIIGNGVTSIEKSTFERCSALESAVIGNGVTSIGVNAFGGCTKLASVTLGNSVTSIGGSAFYNCSALTSVEIPNSVTSIGAGTFQGCTQLYSITIPNSVTELGTSIFKECTQLSYVKLPDNITSIPDETFYYCSALKSIVIPNSVKSIGKYAFCYSKLKSVTIPNSVTSIGEYAFNSCKYLISVEIPNSVTSIGNYAFNYCTELTSVTLGEGITSIGKQTFAVCLKLTSIVIPNSVTVIESSAFASCTALTSATIGNGVTSIGNSAFTSCTGLTSITIPLNVTSIGATAFSGCTGLDSITCEATTPPECGNNAFKNVKENVVVLVPHESVEDYKTADVWKDFSNIQPLSGYGTVTVTFPADVPDGYYENMTLDLLNISSQLVQKRPVSNKHELKFIGQIREEKYQAFLKNAYGQLMGQTDTAELGNAALRLTIDKVLRAKDVSLKVTIPDGMDVTDKVAVLWIDSTGKAMGYASNLKAVAEGSNLKYKVTLLDELARQYVAPDTMQLTVDGEGENLLTLQLQAMQQLALHGLVKDSETGEPISDASVALYQQLGGNYDQSVTATTDTLGRYDLQGTNVQGELSVTAPGYLPKTVEKVAPNAEGTLPTVSMEPFNGAIVSAWLTYAEAVPQGAESKVTDGYKGYSDVAYHVYNLTKSAAIQDFIIKENLLYFPSDVAIGDELIILASSHSSNFSPVSDTCEITTSGIGYVTLPLVQKGGLNATVSSAASNSVMGVLYDANGRFVRSNSYRSAALNFAGIALGDYSLISMTSNTLLRRVLLQSTLNDMGLVEGTDYVKNAVHIEDGRIATVNVPNVPALDMDKLHFTDSTTYFMADRNVVNVGQYSTISARMNFAEKYAGRISNVAYVVDIPEEIDFVENSAILGANAGNYQIEDGHYIFPIADIEDNRLKLCLNPKQAGEFRVSGSVRFKLDGVQMVQPIGTAWIKASGFTMYAPSFLKSSVLYVSGVAPLIYSGKKVEIYDYDKLVGSAEVGKSGTWMANIQLLSNAVTGSHAIKARMIISKTNVIESEIKYVAYNSSGKMAKRVDMSIQKIKHVSFDYFSDNLVFYGHTLKKNWHTVWHIKAPFTTEYTLFAYFDDLATDDADVKIAVLASDGTTRTMDAAYDAAKQCYYATTHYPSPFKLPISAYAYAEREYSPASEEEQAALTETKEKALVKATHAAVNAAKKKGEIAVLPGDDETMNIKYTVPGKEPLAFSMKEMDYNEASAYVLDNEPLIERGEAGNIVYTLVNGTDEMEMILVDVDEHYALRTLVTYAEIDDLGAGSSRRRTGPNKVSLGGYLLGKGASLGSGALTLLGLMDYVMAPEQLMDMDDQIENMQKLLDKELNRADQLLGPCSDGSDPGFTPQQENDYIDRLNDLIDKRNDLLRQMDDARDEYIVDLCRKLLWDAGTTALGAGLAKNLAVGAASKLGPKALAALEKAGSLLETGDGKLAASTLGFAKDLITGGKIGDIPSLDQLLSIDFNRHYKEFKEQNDKDGKEAWEDLRKLNKEMRENRPENCDECEGDNCADECEGEDCDECEGEDCENQPNDDIVPPPYPFPRPACVHLDPSGYIYEAVPSNRVEGATAVVYYKDYVLDEEDNIIGESDVMWDADTYGQVNPQITGADGKYQWDVPQGWWLVRVQKDGYQNNHSDWLPVPPPQLDVNIPLVRNKQPGVKSAHAYEDAVTVRFDSYMLPDSLTTKLITVTENGVAVAGTITLTDEEAAPDGATYASQIRFVPTTPFTATQVTLFISGQVVNYAGIEMDEPYEAILPIEREVKDLVADQTVRVMYGSTGILHVKGTPAAAAAGKTVAVECASGIITSVAQNSVVLNADGEAEVTVQGDLRGTDYVTFTMEDPELTATTRVKVVAQPAFVIEAPEASIPTDTEVERATQITLSCPTEGAKIYYTLDGSNPLTSDTRILYDGTPIVISAETTLTAIAVVEGKGESEVVIYHYTVKLGAAITDVNVSNITVTPVRVHDSFAVNGVDGTFSVTVYSVTGKQLMQLGQVTSGQKVKATALPTGVYLVVVNGEDAYFTQRIIKE